LEELDATKHRLPFTGTEQRIVQVKPMSITGDFLRLLRQEQGLTQEQLVDHLAFSTKEFEALNAVTLSRWETGTTSPSYKKKRELFKFCIKKGWLEKGSGRDYIRTQFESLYEPLTGVFQHNYQTLIANVPRLRIPLQEYELQNLRQQDEPYCYEHIVDIEIASNPAGYYTVSPKTLQQRCHHPASFSLLCERKKQHLGHFIMFKLNPDAARHLVHNRLNENHINKTDLCPRGETGSYYIHALYGVNPTIAALLNTEAYLYLFDHMNSIDTISIFSSRKDGMRLARSYGITTIAHGKNKEFDFTWYGMQSPVEDILFSNTILKLIF
jgi:transcriptional regulator with XRE-family HTH domain